MQVIAVLHHEQPAVSMRLLVRAGSVQDPQARSEWPASTAALLDQGTTTKTAEQIADSDRFHRRCARHGLGSRP
jgi:predicted Zn-dependent peptidase